jgi:hypothetical protein
MPKKSILEKPADEPEVVPSTEPATEPATEPNAIPPIEVLKPVADKPVVEKPVKPKKPRTQAQIDTTNKMREALKAKRSEDVVLRAKAKLEHEELKKHIKKKLFSERVKDKVQKKIKEITEATYESDSESSSSEEYVKPIKTKKELPAPSKPKQNYPVTTARPRTISFF